MSKLIDANIILRYLLNDIPQQADEAAKAIISGAFTIPEVFAEVVYVLTGVYKVERKEIYYTLRDFLDEIDINEKPVINEALRIYADTKLDYVDCVLIARAKILGDDVLGFDKKLNSVLKININKN